MSSGFSPASVNVQPSSAGSFAGTGPQIGGGGLGGAGALGALSAVTELAGGIASIFVSAREARELERRAIRVAKDIRRRGDRVLGAQAVAFAHAGVTQQGTPQDVRNDTIAEIEREVFRSTQGFEDAANKVRGEGVLNLASSLSGAGSKAGIAAAVRKSPDSFDSTTALFGANLLGQRGFGGRF